MEEVSEGIATQMVRRARELGMNPAVFLRTEEGKEWAAKITALKTEPGEAARMRRAKKS